MRDGVIVLPNFILLATNKRRNISICYHNPTVAPLDISKGRKDGTITISEYRYELFVLYHPWAVKAY